MKAWTESDVWKGRGLLLFLFLLGAGVLGWMTDDYLTEGMVTWWSVLLAVVGGVLVLGSLGFAWELFLDDEL